MRYITDRKRAQGLGSAKSGTEEIWQMQMNSWALVVLVPLFVFSIGPVIGAPYEEVVAYLARPFPAIVIALSLLVGLYHFRKGAQVMIEDYSQGMTRRFLIIGAACLSYALMAAGIFALVRLAL